jgi:chemotaxis-related protein WspD
MEKFVNDENNQIEKRLLARPIPKNYSNEWQELLSVEPEFNPDAEILLMFRLGDYWFALPSNIVKKIHKGIRMVHRVPHRTNKIFLGLVNLLGQTYPCVNLHQLFDVDKESEGADLEKKRMILIDKKGDCWVFVADEVYGILPSKTIKFYKPPATLIHSSSNFFRNLFDWKDHSVADLDDDLLFSDLKRNLL